MKMKNTANKGAEWYAERIACLAEFTTSERYEVLRRTVAMRTRYMTVLAENMYHGQNAAALIRHCEAFGVQEMHTVETLCRFGNVRFVLISPDELKTPRYVIDRIKATPSCSYVEVKDLVSVIGDLDVLYMTRVQQERFFNEDDYLRLRDTYILDEDKLSKAKPSMAVLHPLPRINEIAVEVDADPRAAYFEQVKNGMLMRMALESSVVGDQLPGYEPLDPKEVQA